MSAYGKDLIRNTEEFDAWVKKTTREVLNEGCEDKEEITDMLIDTRPDSFPVVGVWVYYRRIHQAFVEWVFPSDFGDALPPVAKRVAYECHVECPHCGGPRDTEGDKPSDIVYCVWCHQPFAFATLVPAKQEDSK